jgi:DNA-binding response OmpR family regulator
MALSAFSPGSYALLLLDLAMPTIHGLALYEKIRKIESKIKLRYCFYNIRKQGRMFY